MSTTVSLARNLLGELIGSTIKPANILLNGRSIKVLSKLLPLYP